MKRRKALKEARAVNETEQDHGQEISINQDDIQVILVIRIEITIGVTGDIPVLAPEVDHLDYITKLTRGHALGQNLDPEESETPHQTSETR